MIFSINYKRFHLKLGKKQRKFEKKKSSDSRVTLRRRCSWGMPETMPISPGFSSTRASEAKDLINEARSGRRDRRRAMEKLRCRRGAAISPPRCGEALWDSLIDGCFLAFFHFAPWKLWKLLVEFNLKDLVEISLYTPRNYVILNFSWKEKFELTYWD